jgi:hypothetical protein
MVAKFTLSLAGYTDAKCLLDDETNGCHCILIALFYIKRSLDEKNKSSYPDYRNVDFLCCI